jgi:2'-aminobiphenyl-2,3-diol 1,2-dioxygenase, small subunit
MSAWIVNQLVQDMVRDQRLVARFKEDEDAVLVEYGMSEVEFQALKVAARPDLASIGMHPLLQIWYMLIKHEGAAKHVTVAEYIKDL